ncbi:MAG: hypothetical protein HGGPFJEG_02750 [Ignavibacteria bacterium]|nr:hypothetical protein [Ignavibacteria bacterium]
MTEIFHKDDFKWSEYYTAIKGSPPRETLISALELFDKENIVSEKLLAIDLGCGSGRDTFELLKRGWNVFAIDKEQSGIDIIIGALPPEFRNKLTLVVSSFEKINLPPADLVNASYSLPFCLPEHFDELWMKIENSVLSGGRFSGVFFGLNDDWSKFSDMTFLEKNKINGMFNNFTIEYFNEKDEDGETSTGEKKHWHVYSVIAKKK